MMTADSLIQQYESEWTSLTPRRQAAFRGNVTWLLAKTTDPAERAQLLELQQQIQPNTGTVRESAPRRFSLFTTRLELKRTRLSVAEAPYLGERIRTSDTAASIARTLIGGQAQEHLLLMLLDVRHQVTGVHTVHIGTTSQCVVHIGDILRVALLANASSVILAHNHPSGDPSPSAADLKVTREVTAAAQLVDISVLDHVIVTDDPHRTTSLAMRQPDLFTRRYQWQ